MAYPDDFETSAFPEGKRIAVSRTVGIWCLVTFLLMIACCIALPWVAKNKTIDPFVIYVDGARGEWNLIGRPLTERDIPYYQSIQRALIGIFTEKWFTISGNISRNEKNWDRCRRDTDCVRRIPNTFADINGCDIYCIAGESMYQKFEDSVLPLYKSYEAKGERWYIDANKITVFPSGVITQAGGTWIARARVKSSIKGTFNIVAFVKIAYEPSRYPQTFGYYITSFNAYKE